LPLVPLALATSDGAVVHASGAALGGSGSVQRVAVTADGGANWRLLPLPVPVSGAAAPPALLQLALPGGPIFLTGMDPA
jgi:hypothetical protein